MRNTPKHSREEASLLHNHLPGTCRDQARRWDQLSLPPTKVPSALSELKNPSSLGLCWLSWKGMKAKGVRVETLWLNSIRQNGEEMLGSSHFGPQIFKPRQAKKGANSALRQVSTLLFKDRENHHCPLGATVWCTISSQRFSFVFLSIFGYRQRNCTAEKTL